MKTLIIGLDAATWRVIQPLIRQGKLPNIQGLIDEGASGILLSTIPPMTPLAWTSIATGVNPGKHGIYDFVAQDRKTYRVAPVNYSHLTRPTIWDVFNAYGRKVGVVNFPLAFPPPKIDSFFVSGLFSPEYEICTHPPELDGYLKSKGYRIHPRFGPENGLKPYFEEVKDLTEIQWRLTVELMKRWDWELFWVIFQGLDWIQHYMWNATIDGKNAVEAFYCYLDKIVGKLVEEAHDDWNIVVLSDHGFLEIEAVIHLNNILEEWGYLKRTETSQAFAERIRNSTLRAGWKLGLRLPPVLRQCAKRYIRKALHLDPLELLDEQFRLHKIIDWTQTRAFSFGYMGCIYIHEKGKYPQGTVEPGGEYNKVREELIAQLRSLKDPVTRKPVVGEIFRKEEIYSGDLCEAAPDIVFNTSDFVYIVYGDFGCSWYHQPKGRVADHNMEGIMIIKGKNIRKGIKFTANANDVTPTLLFIHGLPLLEDMDGKVLEEVFPSEVTESQKVQAVKVVSSRDDTRGPRSEEDEQEIADRLRGLGYL